MRGELCKAACEFIDYGFTVYALNEKSTPLFYKWNTAKLFVTMTGRKKFS